MYFVWLDWIIKHHPFAFRKKRLKLPIHIWQHLVSRLLSRPVTINKHRIRFRWVRIYTGPVGRRKLKKPFLRDRKFELLLIQRWLGRFERRNITLYKCFNHIKLAYDWKELTTKKNVFVEKVTWVESFWCTFRRNIKIVQLGNSDCTF